MMQDEQKEQESERILAFRMVRIAQNQIEELINEKKKQKASNF